MSSKQDFITVRDAANMSGYSENHVRLLMRKGEVQAEKFGFTWMINREDFKRYMASHHRRDYENENGK
jgi:excisionase family DNA binding protein